jgi:hypothetical protein
MENEKTHWKKHFNYNYLGSYSLADGKEVTLTMAGTKKELITGNMGKKEEAFVCYFKEKADWIKPMILNKTNCKIIAKLYNSPYIEDWVGKQITVFIQKGVQAFGETVDALRIKKEKPPKPTLTKSHPSYQAVCDHVRKGNNWSDIIDKFTLPSDIETELKKLIPKKNG